MPRRWHSKTQFENICDLFRNHLWLWWTIVTTLFYTSQITTTLSIISLW